MTTIRGKVRTGNKRGKTLGYPTANIHLHKDIPDGIYISVATLEKKKYPSLTFIGASGTFKETQRKAEVYLLSFDETIYEKYISVKLIKKIRDNKTFDSSSALVNQMKHDTMVAKSYFAKHSI